MTCVIRIALLVSLLCTLFAFGQNSKEGLTSDSSQTQNRTLRVDVDLVLVNVSVTDSSHRQVPGLSKEHFQIWEDKIEQQVQYFSAEDVPLSAGIIFDISGSMREKLPAARAAASTFLRMGAPDDEFLLIEFSNSPQVEQNFTTDITKLQSRLLFTQASGRTSLYDALYLGMEKIRRGSNSRKVLLLITDGEDNHSRYSLADVKDLAREYDVQVYAIGIQDELNLQSSGYIARAVLSDLANLTGGRAFFPSSVDNLESICKQIGIELKNQYVLGYRPLNQSTDGKWRKIRVKINRSPGMPRLSVRSKTGYYATRTAMK